MKQNDWTDLLRQRLANRETPAPDDLWGKIESRLDAAPAARKPGRRYTIGRIAVWSVSAAAAVALLVAIGYRANEDTIGRMAYNRSATPPANARHTSDCAHGMPTGSLCHSHAGGGNARHTAGSAEQLLALNGVRAADAQACTPDGAAPAAECTAQGAAAPDGTPAEGGKAAHTAHADTRRHDNIYNKVYGGLSTTARHGTRWSVGAHAGGSMAGNSQAYRPGMRMLQAAALPPIDGDCAPEGGIMSAPAGNIMLLARYRETKHHAQPLTVGVSVGYALTSRLSLTAGVTYTRAETDFTRSSGADDIVETQQLHYIGIPLGVKYTVWGNRYVQAYATAGAEAGFNVKATMEAENVKTSSERDRVQFALNAAAGVQLNVVPQVGLFAEPGVKYYIDNNSSVQTIFKDKPWAFSLQVGLRVDL